jgi:hypothetical protein
MRCPCAGRWLWGRKAFGKCGTSIDAQHLAHTWLTLSLACELLADGLLKFIAAAQVGSASGLLLNEWPDLNEEL